MKDSRILDALSRSKFRSSFKLDTRDLEYINGIGLEKISSHAVDFITKKLAPAEPKNDGKQTPFRGHPVFKAQHATATCCRSCLRKWYHIPKGTELSDEQIQRAVNIIMEWLRINIQKHREQAGERR